MEDISNEEGISIQIQFEYLNANEEMELSKPYNAKFQPQEDFDVNRLNIINSCDFRTQEERIYYFMFNRNTKVFFHNNQDILNYYKLNKVIIMENCKTFCEQMCEKLREEILTYKKDEQETPDQEELRKSQINDSKKNEVRKILCYLETNFKVDLFAEEFISNNGIQYLDTIIQYNTGNFRVYALQALSKLLDFQSAFDYIDKKKEILSNLYTILMVNDKINASHFGFDIIVKLIGKGNSEDKTMYIIDAAEKYAKKTHTKIFSQIIDNYLSETNKEVNLKILSLIFINLIMNYCHPSKLPRILIQLRDAGIFEFLEKPRKHDEKFEEQVKNFLNMAESVLNDSDYEVEIYKKEIEEMKTHCYETMNFMNIL